MRRTRQTNGGQSEPTRRKVIRKPRRLRLSKEIDKGYEVTGALAKTGIGALGILFPHAAIGALLASELFTTVYRQRQIDRLNMLLCCILSETTGLTIAKLEERMEEDPKFADFVIDAMKDGAEAKTEERIKAIAEFIRKAMFLGVSDRLNQMYWLINSMSDLELSVFMVIISLHDDYQTQLKTEGLLSAPDRFVTSMDDVIIRLRTRAIENEVRLIDSGGKPDSDKAMTDSELRHILNQLVQREVISIEGTNWEHRPAPSSNTEKVMLPTIGMTILEYISTVDAEGGEPANE